MDIVKKNLLSIICGVVAIVAVAAAFTFVSGKFKELQTNLDQRQSTYTQVQGLLTKSRQLPTVSLDGGEGKKLTRFPSEKIIAQGDELVKKVSTESTAMRDAAAEMNVHKLLVPGALPTPSNAQAFTFRNEYTKFYPQFFFTGNGQVTPNPSQTAQCKLAKDMNAAMAPSTEEIQRAVDTAVQKIQREMTISGGQGVINQPAVDATVAEAKAKIPDELRNGIASKNKIYISPDAITVFPQIASPGAPDPINIFYAQMILWVQEDVANAVKDINGSAQNILDAPIKHLAKVTIQPVFMTQGAGGTGGDPDAALPKSYGVSPTGRVSNPLYDVLHFTIEADVDAARLPEILHGLGKERFLTPLTVDIKSVDLAEQLAKGYVFGNKPVVNVTIKCEDLFMRKWTEPLMPAKIKEQLGITTAAAAPAAAATP